MKLSISLALVGLAGALAFLIAHAWVVDPAAQRSALIGIVASTLVGVVALAVKAVLSRRTSTGPGSLKVQLGSMIASFGLRLLAVLAGALAISRQGLPPDGFLLSFFACYVAQQFIEVRYVLGARPAPITVSPEVSR